MNPACSNPTRRRRAATRGIGLIDALIALAILCFGLLSITRLQSRMVTSTTDAQLRQTAVQMADELLNTAIVDVGNAACYTLPQTGTCGNAGAKTRTTDWATRVTTALPSATTPTVTLNAASGQMTLNLAWTSKEASEARQLQVVTDVRP